MKNYPLCKDCKFYKRHFFANDDCVHPNNIRTNYVDGTQTIRSYPSILRYCFNDGDCDESGKWFVSKNETLKERFERLRKLCR
jgi:hypothetical protein